MKLQRCTSLENRSDANHAVVVMIVMPTTPPVLMRMRSFEFYLKWRPLPIDDPDNVKYPDGKDTTRVCLTMPRVPNMGFHSRRLSNCWPICGFCFRKVNGRVFELVNEYGEKMVAIRHGLTFPFLPLVFMTKCCYFWNISKTSASRMNQFKNVKDAIACTTLYVVLRTPTRAI